MQNITSKSGVISFRIWITAILCNTIIGSLILGGLNSRIIDYIVFGGFCGAVFSLPIFFIFWALLRYLLSKCFTWNQIMGKLVLMGSIYSIGAFCIFAYLWGHDLGNAVGLCMLAIISGIIAIVSQFRSVQNICKKRDNEFIIENQSSI